MCIPQDPLSRAAVKNDPFAKATGIAGWSKRHAAQINPLEHAINKKDPIQHSFDAPKAPRAGNLVLIDRQTQ
jgi:hypothetical protein